MYLHILGVQLIYEIHVNFISVFTTFLEVQFWSLKYFSRSLETPYCSKYFLVFVIIWWLFGGCRKKKGDKLTRASNTYSFSGEFMEFKLPLIYELWQNLQNKEHVKIKWFTVYNNILFLSVSLSWYKWKSEDNYMCWVHFSNTGYAIFRALWQTRICISLTCAM